MLEADRPPITGFADKQFVCLCHSSRFSTSGTATNDPASSPLYVSDLE